MSEVSPGDSIPALAPVAPRIPAIPLHRLRVYNPSRMTDQEITLLFAVREEILQRLLADLSGEVPDSRPQHHLLVGQRGMGKTTLLLRIAAALRTTPLRDRFIPLSFAEEQYTIDRLSQFWLNCLDSLADSCERSHWSICDNSCCNWLTAPINRLSAATCLTTPDDSTPCTSSQAATPEPLCCCSTSMPKTVHPPSLKTLKNCSTMSPRSTKLGSKICPTSSR